METGGYCSTGLGIVLPIATIFILKIIWVLPEWYFFNDQQSVTEKINYQSYGTINPLDSSSPSLPSREKFTGKEYDIQGADFARVEFDISVSDFEMGSGSGFLRVAYKDVATGKYFTKIYKTSTTV